MAIAELFYSQFLAMAHAVNLNIYISYSFTEHTHTHIHTNTLSLYLNGYKNISMYRVAVNTLKLTHLIGASYSLLYRKRGCSECMYAQHIVPPLIFFYSPVSFRSLYANVCTYKHTHFVCCRQFMFASYSGISFSFHIFTISLLWHFLVG